jgi:hypothetical protein
VWLPAPEPPTLPGASALKPGIDSILMENNFDNELTDLKRAERKRRTELGMLDLLIDTYPAEAQQKMRQNLRLFSYPTHAAGRVSPDSRNVNTFRC